MRGRRKGGASAPQITRPEGITAYSNVFLSHLAARAYSQASIEAHRWALRQFAAWTETRGTHDPAAFMRSDLEAYQLFLHHYRSPRGGKPLVTNTQLARLGCVRRFFAWLCRSGTIPANPAADLDLPRKQARYLPKFLNEKEIKLLLAIPNPADPFGLRDHSSLPSRKLRTAGRDVLFCRHQYFAALLIPCSMHTSCARRWTRNASTTATLRI